MAGHIRHACEREAELCFVCSSRLYVCDVCGGGEGSLTTDCCGRRLRGGEHDRVCAGTLDYRAGQWVNPKCDDLFEA